MTELLLGVSLGWAAGISPGPLATLVLTTSLSRGFAAGARVAVAPLLTDAPVIAVSLLVASSLPAAVLTALQVAGGLYLVWLGLVTVREARQPPAGEVPLVTAAADIRRGVLTNLLSPHPWLFWVAVGGPLLVGAWERTPWAAAAFLGGFFGLLVGSKLVLAAVAAHGRRFVSESWYRRSVVVGGILIAAMGVWLVIS